jgi:hypothetical protein
MNVLRPPVDELLDTGVNLFLYQNRTSPSVMSCSAPRNGTSFQHAVKMIQHMISHRDNRAFLATP